jgi:hypothetical protein
MVQQQPGLPNGVFLYRKSQLGYIFEGLRMKNDADLLIPLTFLLPFGIFYGNSVYFVIILVYSYYTFWYAAPRKIWQPWMKLKQILGNSHGMDAVLPLSKMQIKKMPKKRVRLGMRLDRCRWVSAKSYF